MEIVSVLVFFCLISAVITYGLGLCVYTRNPGSAVNRLFLLGMLAATYWAAGEFMIWQSASYDAVRFWLKASSFWLLSIVITLHFILAFTRHPLAERQNLKYLLVFLYLPAILMSLVEIFTDLVFRVIWEPGSGYVYIPVMDGLGYLAESAAAIWMVFAFYIGISSWLKQEPGRLRQQYLSVTIGILIVLLSGAMSAFIFPLSGIHVPNMVFIGMVCLSGIISYAMIREGLFTLTPESAAVNIVQLMPDGLVLADTTGRIITSNPSAEILFGKTKGEMTGRPVDTILPLQSTEEIQAALRERGTFLDLEAVLKTPEYRVVSIAGSLITSPEGEPAGFVLIIHDITGRKKSERALRLAKEKVSLLSQLTRHDVTNLITAINGYILLLSEKLDDPVSEQYIAACSGILEKIDRHLQFSREYEEIGKHEPVWQSVEAVVSRAKSDLAFTRAEISVSVLPFWIYADPLSVKVMYNLLENALRHGGFGMTLVRVTAEEQPGGELVIAIEDNGAGIPPDQKEHIFEHGFGKNTGLGLTLSREILAVTDIHLIETGVPGTGARFEMHIPPQSWRKS
jgi:PAS domain S-box-containing protein